MYTWQLAPWTLHTNAHNTGKLAALYIKPLGGKAAHQTKKLGFLCNKNGTSTAPSHLVRSYPSSGGGPAPQTNNASQTHSHIANKKKSAKLKLHNCKPKIYIKFKLGPSQNLQWQRGFADKPFMIKKTRVKKNLQKKATPICRQNMQNKLVHLQKKQNVFWQHAKLCTLGPTKITWHILT